MPKPITSRSEPTAIDWARLAAFIDGEGNIRIRSRLEKSGATRLFLECSVSNSDPRLTSWIQSLFGGSVSVDLRQRNENCRPCFRWTAVSKMAGGVISQCFEYFVIKRDQAEIALAFLGTVKRVGGKRHSQEVLSRRIELQHSLQGLHGWLGVKHGKSRAILALESKFKKGDTEAVQ